MANSLEFEAILYEMWHEITLKTGKLLKADRTTIFLLEPNNHELWSVVSNAGNSGFDKIRIPANTEIIGEVVNFNRVVNIPFDFYDDPRSSGIKERDLKTGYRTYTQLALPLFHEEGELMAVVQLFNKLKTFEGGETLLSEKVDTGGFTPADEDIFAEFVPLIRPILEKCRTASPSAVELAEPQKSFSSFLSPLSPDIFEQTVKDLGVWKSNQDISSLEQIFLIFDKNLFILDSLFEKGAEATLNEILRHLTLKIGEIVGADRTTIFLLDREQNEFWTIVTPSDEFLEIRIPGDRGIIGEVAAFKKTVNIPFDFHDDPRSAEVKQLSQKNGYRIYTVLGLPVLDKRDGNLVAVVHLLNKLKHPNDPEALLFERVDMKGFTDTDEALFAKLVPEIRPILEKCQLLYTATQKQQKATALISAIRSLSKSSLDLDETLQLVMNEARKLMKADRGTVWLFDREKNELWTKIFIAGTLKEIRIPIRVGFVGQVAQSGEPIVIGFDVYEHPDTDTVKQTDRKVGYRTCSLLCIPIFNAGGELIGVTQLVNKQRKGDFPHYNPNEWPQAPECWKESFSYSDRDFMQAFNIQAGIILQNAMKFGALKQQEQIKQDILRSFAYGVISTNKAGQIVTVNESAKHLLGFRTEDELEGRSICELIHLPNANFSEYFQAALDAKSEQERRQYYPAQILTIGDEQHIINLSVNSIANGVDTTNIYGVLVVMDSTSDEKQLKRQLYQYMTPELVEQLLQNDASRLESDSPMSLGQTALADALLATQTVRERKDVSVLFSGIRSFTPLLENLEDQEVNQLLKEYFESMTEAVFKYKGTIDKYVGDAIMATFGSPLPLDDHAWSAVQTAVEMRYRLVELNVRRVEDGKQAIRIGIGINSDSIVTSNLGASQRIELSTLREGVNLGSQLEKASKQYGCDIIISETTYLPCEDRVWAREIDWISIQGKDEPLAIYQLVGLRSEEIPEEKLQVIEYYSEGRRCYRNRQFDKAIAAFSKVLEISSWDKPAAIQIERCQHWLQSPPPADWDGVWTLTEL